MKPKVISLAAAVSILPFMISSQATDQNIALIGVQTTYSLQWDHVPEPLLPEQRFAIYTNGVLAQVLTTNHFNILTNGSGTNTYVAQFVAPPITSRDVITLTALNALGVESEPCEELTLITLGKPKRPTGLHKR